jgi:hypothetical protein
MPCRTSSAEALPKDKYSPEKVVLPVRSRGDTFVHWLGLLSLCWHDLSVC